jgi:predicted alpha/beta superfamily hydrolase
MANKVTNNRIPFLIFTIFGMMILLFNAPSLSCEYHNFTESKVKIYSQILSEERTLSITLPDEYEATKNVYPVLYVLDAEGEKLFPGCISTVVDLYKKGRIPQMIVIGIWNTSRNRDMIPDAVSHRPGSGGSFEFLSFIKEELMPYIGQNFRTTELSMLYGMSNSALFTVYALLEMPETFNAYIASSPMIGHCPDFIQKKADAFISKDQLKDTVLYMIYGAEDSQRVTDYVPEFQKYLKAKAPPGFDSKLEILEGEGHVPDSSLERGLQYIFKKNEINQIS